MGKKGVRFKASGENMIAAKQQHQHNVKDPKFPKILGVAAVIFMSYP